MAIIGYARASTEDQKLDAQIVQLKEAKCERIYQEKVSGAKVDRPELVAMLDYVREGDTVVVTKLDRIARSTKHLLEITDLLKKKSLVSKICYYTVVQASHQVCDIRPLAGNLLI